MVSLLMVILATSLPTADQSQKEASVGITVLVDAFSDRSDVRKDWGYSALIEHQGKRILFDTGNDSELFRHNVEVLGVDLRRLDYVVISHRHGDHTDGLRYLLSINPEVKIYVADDEYFGGPTPGAFFARGVHSLPTHKRYFDGRVPDSIPHGSPWRRAKFERVTAELEILPGVRVVPNISQSTTFRETPELSLALDTVDGQILVVGCSHPGIEQILQSVEAKSRRVRLLVGGLHWVSQPDHEVERLSRALKDEWGIQAVAPGHCTGEFGFSVLGGVFGRRYVYAGLGSTFGI